MSSQNTSEFCIANQDIPLVKDDGQSTWIKGKAIELLKDIGLASGSPDHLLKGDLIAIDGYTSKGSVHGTLVSDHSKRIECPKSNVTSVTDTEYRLLAPIKVASARWDLFNSTDAMQIVRRLKLDERVWVSIPVNEGSISVAGSGCLPGTIRYIGPIQDEIGTYFGIELQVSALCECCIVVDMSMMNIIMNLSNGLYEWSNTEKKWLPIILYVCSFVRTGLIFANLKVHFRICTF
jgi:hypothetical protein